MPKLLCLIILTLGFTLPHIARAAQADDTTIAIDAEVEGATPFIHQLTLTVSNPVVLKASALRSLPKPDRSLARSPEPMLATTSWPGVFYRVSKFFCRFMGFMQTSLTPYVDLFLPRRLFGRG